MAQRAADQCTGRGLHHSNMQVISFLRNFDLSYVQDLSQLRQVDVQVISSHRHFDLSESFFCLTIASLFFKLVNSDIEAIFPTSSLPCICFLKP